MPKKIHATAIVSKKARLGKDVEVSPYAIIEGGAVIKDGTKIGAHCVIYGNATLGKNCQLFTGVVIGSPPQDLKYRGEKSFLEIGDNNIIREYCTFNPGTSEGGKTIVGNNNFFMAYAHVAHDCRIGSHCLIANCGTLAGHVVMEDHSIVSGLAAVHQFVRIGRLAIVGGCSKVVQDIPPFSTCDGHPAHLYGLNLVGLKRNNIPRDTINKLDRCFKILFNSGLTMKNALAKVKKEIHSNSEIACLIDFIKNSTRGVVRANHFKQE